MHKIRALFITCTNSSIPVHAQCMYNDSDFCPPGCHFLYIFASKVSRKNKNKVSQFFVQSVTNETSTLRTSVYSVHVRVHNRLNNGNAGERKIQTRKYESVFELMYATKVSCNVVLLEIPIC